MIIDYYNNKYYFIDLKAKVKNEFSFIYKDNYLKDLIYVLNSNLIRQSYVRRQLLKPSRFNSRSSNVSIYKNFLNK